MIEAEIKGCRILFKAIIARAVKDAFTCQVSGSSATPTRIEKQQARYFLCEDPAFGIYCDYADVSATRLRRVCKQLVQMKDRELINKCRQELRGIVKGLKCKGF